MEHTVHYGEVYSVCQSVIEGNPKKLLEAVAESLAAEILSTFSLVKGIRIQLIKPDPPIPGHYKSVAVDITRGGIYMNKSYLSLGSNMGDRVGMLRQAVRLLKEHPAIEVMNISSLYETAPVGFTEQDVFLNMVVQLQTSLTAYELLEICQDIEQTLDRKREIRWGPRTIDLDILLYNQDEFETENLVIPHPRMHERAFVLVPLLELDPEQDFIEPQREGIEIWKTYNSVESFLLEE
nr:2-amino-4-hydroxy-6-hydroxymethyldihydropteridine diphosphokinase [Planomicrobium sp.]